MIIDCHTHIFPDQVRRDRKHYCERDKGFLYIYQHPKTKIAGAEELVSSMDETGVEQSVICGFPWGSADLCSLHNRYLLESASKYPHRLIVFVTLLFSDPEWSERELDWAMKNGAVGVGEIAYYQNEMTSQDIESIRPLLAQMEEKRIPLLLHTNEQLGHPYPGKGSTPLERFYEIVLAFPTLPILLAHWGGGLPFYELMPEVSKAMSHVYYDTAASPFLYSKKIYAIVSKMVGVEKILFGTDFPLLSPKRYFKELEESGLSKEDQEKILGLNFLRLMKVEVPTARIV